LGKKTRKISGLRLRGDVYYADTTANGVRISERIGNELRVLQDAEFEVVEPLQIEDKGGECE
jgi:hypothetical protein